MNNDRWDDNLARVLVAYRWYLGPPLALLVIALAMHLTGFGLEDVVALVRELRPD